MAKCCVMLWRGRLPCLLNPDERAGPKSTIRPGNLLAAAAQPISMRLFGHRGPQAAPTKAFRPVLLSILFIGRAARGYSA